MTFEDTLRRNLKDNPGALSLLSDSMNFMDELFDADQNLLRVPDRPAHHNVRESVWYAFGLILQVRFAGADPDRLELACRVTTRVLQEQMHAPGDIWHGTFKRHPTEPTPPPDAIIWKDYDPNWRQFIGTVLVLMVALEGTGALASIRSDIETALQELLAGEPEDRVPHTYTNIALMKSWLELTLASTEADKQQALSYAGRIYEGFNRHGAFLEYNSPTYYGINLFALSLWTDFSDDLAQMGQQLTSQLWQDIGRYYHPDMKNLCGPWSRSYGMNMQSYAAAVGLWMWSLLGRENAPVPQTHRFAHAHDFCLGPLAAACCSPPQTSVITDTYPREIAQTICKNPTRTALAHIDQQVMIGLETSDVSFHGNDQYHPLTAHWQAGGKLSWLRLRLKGRLGGTLNATTATIELHPDAEVNHCRIEFSQTVQATAMVGLFVVAGMEVHIQGNATQRAKGDTIEFAFPAGETTHMTLSLILPPARSAS